MAREVTTRQERRFRGERLQRGSPHGPTARKGGLGKKQFKGAPYPANGKKGGLGEKSYRGAAYALVVAGDHLERPDKRELTGG